MHHHIKIVYLSILLFAASSLSTDPPNGAIVIATSAQSAVTSSRPEQTSDQPAATTELPLANCNLQVKVPDSVRQHLFPEDDDEDPVNIVYANLKFENLDLDSKTGYLSNTTHYITPLRWTLASGRRGDVLLGFPAIFRVLSLWTLSVGVISADVAVNADACPNFLDAPDTTKQDLIAIELYKSVNTSSMGLPDFKVCQEIAHIPSALLGDATWVAILFNIYFVVYNTRHECWYEGENGNLLQRIYSPPVWFLPPILTLGIMGAVIVPLMAVMFAQRNNSPFVKEITKKDEHGNKVKTGKVRRYYNRRTTVPVGFKYIIAYYTTPLAVILRFILLCVLIFVILCPEVFFPLDSTYRFRVHTYYRNDYLKIAYYGYHVARAVIILIPLLSFLPSLPMLCRSAYKWRRFKLADLPSGIHSYHAESSLERSYFGLFPFADVGSHIPRHPQTASGLSTLNFYMLRRIQTALEVHILYSCYAQSLKRIWNGILRMMWPEKTKSVWNIMSAATCVLTILILLPVFVAFNFVTLLFSSIIYLLPSAYILLCITNTHAAIISFTHRFYHNRIWKWLSGAGKGETFDQQTVAMETIAMETKEEDDVGNVALDIEPKQSVVKFRRGSGGSGNAYIEHVFRPGGTVRRGWEKIWPLHQFYADVYELMIGYVEDEEGQSRSATLCLQIAFVLFAVLYAFLLLTAIVLAVFLVQFTVSVIVVLLSSIFIVYFFRFIALCTLLGSVLLLAFTGLVMNTFSVMPFCILGLSLFGFIVSTITNLYSTYSDLLKMVIEIAKASRPDLCSVLIEKSEEKVEVGDDDDDVYEEEEEEEEEKMQESTSKTRKKTGMKVVPLNMLPSDQDLDSEVMIEEKLFWYVVDKCVPLRLQVVSRLLQIILVILGVAVGIAVLVDIGELLDYSHFGVTLVTLVITLLITNLRTLFAANAEDVKEDQKSAVKNAVVKFDGENKH